MKLFILILLCASPVFAHPHHEQIEEVIPEVQTPLSEHTHH